MGEVHRKICELLEKNGFAVPVRGDPQPVFLEKILACLTYLDERLVDKLLTTDDLGELSA